MAEDFFNGGGHLNAAGGKLSCSMDEAIEVAKRAIEAYKEKLCE
jgi:phosphoesterase RecJ-like protein